MILRVRSLTRATPSSCIVRLELGRRRFRFRPGQSVKVGLAGQGLRKPYSIASAPAEADAGGELELLIMTDGRGRFGPHLEGIRRGARVEVVGPVGSFVWPRQGRARHVLFVAGGAGVAPLRSMLRDALRAPGWGRLTVLYSARSARHFAFGRELRRLARQGRIELIQTVTRDTPAGWRGRRGRIDRDLLVSAIHTPTTLCVVCGPPGFVATVSRILGDLGVSPRRIRREGWRA